MEQEPDQSPSSYRRRLSSGLARTPPAGRAGPGRLAAIAAAFAVWLPAPSHADLPPPAQAAFDQAMAAAQQQQWDVAIQQLQTARASAPDAPELFFNLGLAESKVPGRELLSMVWFGGYLCARPDAANAPAVRSLIAELKARYKGNVDRLIQAEAAWAAQIPDTDDNRTRALVQLISDWVATGNLAAASDCVRELARTGRQTVGLEALAEAQAAAGDVAQATATARRIDTGDRHDLYGTSALLGVSSALGRAGDLADAADLVAQVAKRANAQTDADVKDKMLAAVIDAQTEELYRAAFSQGNLDAASQALSEAATTAANLSDPAQRARAEASVANYLAWTADFTGARRMLSNAARSDAALPQHDQTYLDNAQTALEDMLDAEPARLTIADLHEATAKLRLSPLVDGASPQAPGGAQPASRDDLAVALAAMAPISPYAAPNAYKSLLQIAAKIGDADLRAIVQRTIMNSHDQYERSQKITLAWWSDQAERRSSMETLDLSAYLRSQLSDDPVVSVGRVHVTAHRMLEDLAFVDRKLKAAQP